MTALQQALEEAKIIADDRVYFQNWAKKYWEDVDAKLLEFGRHIHKATGEFAAHGFGLGSGGSLWKFGRKVAEAEAVNIGAPTGVVIRWSVSIGGGEKSGQSESTADFDRDFGKHMGRWI